MEIDKRINTWTTTILEATIKIVYPCMRLIILEHQIIPNWNIAHGTRKLSGGELLTLFDL
jgi:hypothetical protein